MQLIVKVFIRNWLSSPLSVKDAYGPKQKVLGFDVMERIADDNQKEVSFDISSSLIISCH